MASRSGAVHVATTTRRYKNKLYQTHLLRHTYREGNQVKHETLGNLSHLPVPVIELIRRSLRGEVLVNAQDAFEVVRSLRHGHVAAARGTLRRLQLHALLGTKASRERELVTAMVIARVLDPTSKLATARGLGEEHAVSSFGGKLGVGLGGGEGIYKG